MENINVEQVSEYVIEMSITKNILNYESEAARESESSTAKHQYEIDNYQNDKANNYSHFPIFPHHLSLNLF